MVSCYSTRAGKNTDRSQCASHGQIGLGLPLLQSHHYFELEEENPNHPAPSWLDKDWYRRLALPSVDPERDRITSWESD